MFGRFLVRFRQFMYGRYGSDKLNVVLMIAAGSLLLTSSALSFIAGSARTGNAFSLFNYILELIALLFFGWALFRTLSRNHAARQRENRAFFSFWRKLTDRKNRYFSCPHCNQTVRVPRGRGQIRIKCPRCGERFIKKT